MNQSPTDNQPHRVYRACGGVVLDPNDRVLLIERHVERDGQTIHEVRLPKGKPDPGEADVDAALREVGEETGYWQLEVIGDLGEGSVRYTDRQGRDTHRDERYYLMRLKSDHWAGQRMKPGSEEALFDPLWASDLPDAEQRLTYDGEKTWARRAIAYLAANRSR